MIKEVFDLFPAALEITFQNEGIKADDPYDKGGKTIFGIASFYHRLAYEEIAALYDAGLEFKARETAKEFYRVNYWNELYNYIQDSSLTFKIFDFGVNAGRRRSVKYMQQTVNTLMMQKKLKLDGVFGEKTLTEINLIIHRPDDEPYQAYIVKLEKFYRTRSLFRRFGKGWLKRLRKRKELRLNLRDNSVQSS